MIVTAPVVADTAAVMVTHNGERHLPAQISSIFSQTTLPAVLVVVDDASTDATRGLLHEAAASAPIPVEVIELDGSRQPDRRTRIASNVMRGLEAVRTYPVTLLADQDDEWLPERVQGQRRALLTTPGALLAASDGILIDQDGTPMGETLRDRFPVPRDWDALDGAAKIRVALRQPIVTGACAALTAEMITLLTPMPRGWLHDRWATLVAVARMGLVLQRESTIRYRVHEQQAIGTRDVRLDDRRRRWQQVLDRGASPVEAAGKARDIVRRIRPLATSPAGRSELSWAAVLRAAIDRA